MATPDRGLRRVPFAGCDMGKAGGRASALPPSPYTPFGSRRASLTPSSAARRDVGVHSSVQGVAHRDAAGSTAGMISAAAPVLRDFAKPESADAFARGAAEVALRSSCLDVVAAVGPDADALAQEIAAALEVQISFAEDLQADRGAHAYARREVARVANALRVELDTWTLVHTAWRAADLRPRDQCSRLAALRFEDDMLSARNAPAADACRRALEWLETVAAERLDRDGGPRVRPLDDPAYRWHYTSCRVGAALSADYPLRHARAAAESSGQKANRGATASALEEVELKADRRLAREVFRLVRCGRAKHAEELCRQVGQPWRAAALGGGQRASELSASGLKGHARAIWRKAASSVATSPDAAVSPHERAVCAVLAGILEPVLSVAESHEDLVWARLSVLLDSAIECSLASTSCKATGTVESESRAVEVAESGDEAMRDVGSPAATVVNVKGMTLRPHKGGSGDVAQEATKSAAGLITFGQVLEAFRESKIPGDVVEGVPADVLQHVRMVRGFLALGPSIPLPHVVSLMEEIAVLSSLGRKLCLEWVCRFAAHVAIFVKKSGLVKEAGSSAVASFEDVMISYARLSLDQELANEVSSRTAHLSLPIRPIMYDLVARHLAELETVDRLVNVYVEVMASALRGDLREEWSLVAKPGATVRQVHERRTLCLQRAGKCFGRHGREALNSLVVSSVDYVWNEYLPGYVSDKISVRPVEDGGGRSGSSRAGLAPVISRIQGESDEMTRDDELVVRAIEFLIFPGFGHYEEALRRATTAARRFFLLGKRASARHVVEWFPSEALAQVPVGSCENEMHELECWRAYMTAISRHNEWRSYYFSQRPQPLDEKVRAAALANPGEVSYEVQAAASLKMESYTQQMESYAQISESARHAAAEALRGALLHDGGWMRDARLQEDDSAPLTQEAAQRLRETRAVRKVAIPQLTALLHHVLHESGFYAEAADLATLVADDGLCLYEDFEPVELGAFMHRVAQSAVLLVDTSVKSGDSQHPYPGQFFEETKTGPVGRRLFRE